MSLQFTYDSEATSASKSQANRNDMFFGCTEYVCECSVITCLSHGKG